MEWMECMGVYGSVWESTWVHINIFSKHEFMWVSWVYVTVRNFCDSHGCMWVYVNVLIVFECMWVCECTFVYVRECEGYNCIRVYLCVFESMWVYVSVVDCIWVYVNVMSVFECCMNIKFATFSGTTYRISPSLQHLHSNSPAKIQDTCQDRYQIGIWSFPNTPKSAGWWANFGISMSWPSLHTGHQRIYTNFNSTRRVVCDIGVNRCKRRDTHQFAHIHATQGE